MKAIILKSFGNADQLELAGIPLPVLRDGEVLVDVKAISINPVDVKSRKGKGQAARLQEDPPMILGWDISGIITETNNNNPEGFKKGDEVFGMINLPGLGKAYAEFVAAPAAHLAIKPVNRSHEECAAASLAAMTAWQALHHQANVIAGQKVLIHAASGGVGHYAVQMAKYLGAYVIGTSSAANRDFVLSIGADEHIDYTAQPFEDAAPEVDIILDTIGGDNIDRSLHILKPGGTIVALPSGISESVTEKAAAQGKKGIFFFVRSNSNDMTRIASLLKNGTIKSHISKIFRFDQIREAHRHMESGKTVGKLVVSGW